MHSEQRLELILPMGFKSCSSLPEDFRFAFAGERALHLPTRKPVEYLSWNPKHLVLAFTGSFSDGSSSADRGSTSRSGSFHIFAPKS